MKNNILRSLSLQNARRQARDYMIYIITMVIAAAILYTINATVTSKSLDVFGGLSSTFITLLYILDVIVILIVGWLVNYMARFMLEKRSKEFGIYFLMGMETKQVSIMFLKENLYIGIAALFAGIFTGGILYQVMQSVMLHIFEMEYHIRFAFSLRALLLTSACYLAMLLYASFRSRKKLQNVEIHNLLYAQQENEETILSSPKKDCLVFIGSILLLIAGVVVIWAGFAQEYMDGIAAVIIGLVCFIICIFFYYHSVASFLAHILTHNKKWKYKNQRMFLARMLTSKVNTVSNTIAIIAVLFTLSIICMAEGRLLGDLSKINVTDEISFDIQADAEEEQVIQEVAQVIEDTQKAAALHTYQLYFTHETQLYRFIENSTLNSKDLYTNDFVMALSDYNALREMLGGKAQALDEGELIIQSREVVSKGFKERFLDGQKRIKVNNKLYRCKFVYDEPFSMYWFNGFTYLIVLPDAMARLLPPENRYRCVGQMDRFNSEIFRDEISGRLGISVKEEDYFSGFFMDNLNVRIRDEAIVEQKKGNILTVFPVFYIAFVLVLAAVTILSVQQLSDISKNKRRYHIMEQLGLSMEKKERMIFVQALIFFMLPAVLPIIISGYSVIGTSLIYATGLKDGWVVTVYVTVLIMFFILYAVYFLASYLQFRRMMEEQD